MRTQNQSRIEERIIKAEYGTVFVTSDFTDIASFDSANRVLNRLVSYERLKRVMRGIYYKPKYNSILNEYIAPTPDNVAKAIARNYGWDIAPSGEVAMNMLGISTQVPTVWSYVCNGAYREYSYGNILLKFQKTTGKEISNYSYNTVLVIQALKAYGKTNINDKVISKISRKLSQKDKQIMLAESRTTTAWIYETIKNICNWETIR